MRKADLRHNHQRFDQAIGRYRGFMQKILPAQRVITLAQEKRDIAESVLLRICAHWERFVDEHLIDCVNVDHSMLGNFFGVRIPSNPSKDPCQALVLRGGYTDFRSFGDLKGFSKKILPDRSNPFLVISPKNVALVDQVFTIRNYLAHYSNAARRSLHKLYKSKYGMTNFLEPAQFLLGHNANRLWSYFGAFEGASNDMKATY
jgi:hypothetical protein